MAIIMTSKRVALAGVVLLAAVPSAQQVDPRPRPLAITRVNVVDAAAGAVVPEMTVVIQDGRIASVDKDVTVPRGAEVVDGRNKFLIPGFWDMHVHLSYARSSALPAFVANGVTGVRDIGSDLSEIDRWRAQIEDNSRVGPVIVRAGPMLNGMEFNRYQLLVADAVEARAAVRTLQKVGVDFIKFHRRTSREAFFGIAETARALKLPFAGHVPMTVTPAEASDAGQATIEHTETLFEGTFTAERAGKDLAAEIARWRSTDASALFARFVKNGTFVDPTLIAQEYLMRELETNQADANAVYIAASARQERENTLAGIRPSAEKMLRERKPFISELRAVTALMSREGVPLLAGTDTSFLHPPGFTLHDELQSLVDSGVSTPDVLRAATVNPARLFPQLETGQIAAGKRADLVLLDANPLADIRNTRRITAVVARGRWLNRVSLDRLLREAVARANQE
jgi:imidazolonepropionase-like amidohydrolase